MNKEINKKGDIKENIKRGKEKGINKVNIKYICMYIY